jgi:benzoyl-CoA reductase/2-hydroxyglutaryl-CoA dehydratase subunit BcrC/BadD/HgdB
MTAIDTIRALYSDREAWAKQQHAAGKKVVGYCSNNIPVELILAAGLQPVELTGSPAHATAVGDEYMETIFDGHIRSLFDRTLTGQFNFCDLILIPRSSEGYLELYYFLDEVRKWEPNRKFPEIYLFDLLQTPYWTTGRYVRGRVDALKAKLEQVAGHAISAERLLEAVKTVNRSRDLLRDINTLRRSDPPRLSGGDMLKVIAASGFTERGAYNALLEELAKPQSAGKPLSGARLMVKGSPQGTTEFYDLVEKNGAVVVADDHVNGERAFDGRVREAQDLLDAISFYYQTESYSPRSYPQSTQDARFMANVEAAGVDGVIFFVEEHDDTLGWDYPDQKKLLDARGIPSVYLVHQSYRTPDRAAQTAAVRDLVQRAAARRKVTA